MSQPWRSPVHTTNAEPDGYGWPSFADAALKAAYERGRKQAAAEAAANALMKASNDIVSARSGRMVATPRLRGGGDAKRISDWLRRLADIYAEESNHAD